MPLDSSQREVCQRFREWITQYAQGTERFKDVETLDRDDESLFANRWKVDDTMWCEVALKPMAAQIRVAILTDDRWRSEEMEQQIEDSGDDMYEFVGTGFCDVGLDWEEPPVEHYRDAGKWFYFATPIEFESLDAFEQPQNREKIGKMLEGYHQAFFGD